MEENKNAKRIMANIKVLDYQKKPYAFIQKNNSITFEKQYFSKNKKGVLIKRSFKIPLKDSSETTSNRLGDLKTGGFQKSLGTITVFKRNLIKILSKNSELLNLNIKNEMGATTQKYNVNYKAFDNLSVGDSFTEIDLKVAYIQSAYKLGYTTDKFYHEKKNIPELKQSLREAITWVHADIKKHYYNIKGFKEKEAYVVRCDVDKRSERVFNRVFKNIMNNLHNTIFKCVNEVGAKNCIKYNIDAVLVDNTLTAKVINLLNELGWEYSVNQCVKISENQYINLKNQKTITI